MKKIPFFALLLLLPCHIPLGAQIMLAYRLKADSCAQAGNLRAADSIYTIIINTLPEAQDYTARAAIRRKTEPCRACSDLFTASVMGDKSAVKLFRTTCYRANQTQLCAPDSFSLFCARGKVTVKQQIDNGYYRILNTDTAFKKISTNYLLGKDTLRLSADSCPLPDSLRFKIYKYIGDHSYYPRTSILPFVIGLYSKPEESSLAVQYIVTFSHTGVVLDAQTAGGARHDVLEDAQILRLFNEMPPLGNLGCNKGIYRYSFVIYFSHQW
ncbi:MAG: hypothetical protein MUC87_01425 [Bacteroidia bacterium]|jgi:hypothetical protein|nr:hypothetical protein [Bacteroidia bacterium]